MLQPCCADYTIYSCQGEQSGKGGLEWGGCVLGSHFYPFYTRVTPWTLTLDIDTLHGSTMRNLTRFCSAVKCFKILKMHHQTNSIYVFGRDKLPVTAPALLLALSKISVQILFAPGGRKNTKVHE